MNHKRTNYCPVCGGNGQFSSTDYTPCNACNGTGRTDKDYNERVARLRAKEALSNGESSGDL